MVVILFVWCVDECDVDFDYGKFFISLLKGNLGEISLSDLYVKVIKMSKL